MANGEDAAASASMPGHLIRRLHQISTLVFLTRVRAAGFDLTPVQFATLDALGHRPGQNQASLARAIAKDRATVGAVLDRLERKDLVARPTSPWDKRARQVSLTKEGAAVLDALRAVVEGLQREILPGLSESEYRSFVALAAKASAVAASQGDE